MRVDGTFFQRPPWFRQWLPFGLMCFFVLGMFQGLGGFGKRQWLGWSGLVVESGYSENFARDLPVLGRGSH